MIDVLIKNALVVDGSGNRPFTGDVAIDGNMITDIGDLNKTKATTVIEAKRRIISPGFIDMHSHSDVLFSNGSPLFHKLYQGVTTELIGQDGISAAPLTDSSKDFMAEIIEPMEGKIEGGWKPWDMHGFFETLINQKVQLNVATLTGHCNLRMAVMGHKMATASQDDLQKMGDLLAESFEQGSIGLSLGLIYPPSSYSDTDELIALGNVVKKYNGILVAHIRNEQDQVIDALDEMITISEKSGCRIHISHLKCLGKKNWDKMPQVLELIDKAFDQKIDVTFDQYPYNASNTSLSLLLPSWAMEGGYQGFKRFSGDLENRKKILTAIKDSIESRGDSHSIKIASVRNDKNRGLTGKSIDSLSESWGMPVEEAVLTLLTEEKLQVMAIYHAISNSDIECAMTHHLHTVGSDGVLGEHPHPRVFGTFARIVAHYSGEKKLFPLEVAIRKMTAKPAEILRLEKRGQIKKGYYADLIIFEQDKFVDNATFDSPKQFASGLDWVFINGKPSIRDGCIENSFAGSVLKNTRRK